MHYMKYTLDSFWGVRDNFVYAPGQWEPTLQYNVESLWLGAYIKWPLCVVVVIWCQSILSIFFRVTTLVLGQSYDCPNAIVAILTHDDVIKWKHFPRYWRFCEGHPPVTSGFPSQRPVTQSFGVFFDLRLNKRGANNGDLKRNRARYI